MADMHALVPLRNGSQEPRMIVATTSMAIDRLMQDMPVALFDLVELARNGTAPFPPCAERLTSLALMTRDGRIHDSIRNIVLSSFEGNDMDMQRVSPFASA
jgi:hypothetical protein